MTATTNTNIRELARVLLAQDIRGLPIVNEAGEVVGVVTRGDILRALVNYAPLELWL
ncbi:CBS domain-containing protein [Halothiobacillus sp.]|uniref:CBS domain-containing protein n=1 Tax=Halothiobacillus sp. TaxID=1891311 RepID=UPI00260F5F7A|nr:CBS domain-containing protein [Halothiobacillus sp.]